MKKTIKIFCLFVIGIIISACNKNSPEELNDLIVTPELTSPILEGTWQVTKVEEITGVSNTKPPEIGDRLYINKDIVAINKEYAYPPSFSSKYVNLNKYLENKGYSFDNIDINENVVVVNASEGQFFSRDFVKRSDEEIFYIADNNLVYLSKVSDDVSDDIINSYEKIAKDDRDHESHDSATKEDTSLLLGVRERTDLSNKQVEYNYYTYLIKIPKDKDIKYLKANDIFLRGQDEFWKVRSKKSTLSGLYDNIEAFPVRLEEKMDDQTNLDRYSFKDFDMNIRLSFVDKNYISFSYQRQLFDNTITKYGFVATNELEDNRLITIDEFTGDKDAYEQFEYMVVNEATNLDSKIEPSDIKIDSTNFGLVRDSGSWVSQTSIYTENSLLKAATQIPMRNYVEEDTQNNTNITRDQVRNINNQFIDYHILNNGNYIVIQSADEILIHKIDNGNIEKEPLFSIPTPNSTAFISIDQQSGQNADTLNQAFVNNNKIIESN